MDENKTEFAGRPAPAMDMATAERITAACLRTCYSTMFGGEYVPLPDCSLIEMLQANAIIGADRGRPNEDGSTTILMNCDPRIIAAHYAFEQYWRDPHDLLEAIGLRIREPGDSHEGDSGCAGEGACHGTQRWCDECGDVSGVCEDIDCDVPRHTVEAREAARHG
jgi:hypothetical protein